MGPLRQFQTAEKKNKAAHAAGLSGTFSGKRKSVLEPCLNLRPRKPHSRLAVSTPSMSLAGTFPAFLGPAPASRQNV